MSQYDMMTAPRYVALAAFRYQVRCFLAFSEQQARAAGLDPRQHQLLLAVKGLPKGMQPTIGTLAERLQLKHHTVVELVDRMETQRLVTRHPNPADRRQVFVKVTRKGERLLEKLSRAHERELRTAGPRLLAALKPLLGPARGSFQGVTRVGVSPRSGFQGVNTGPALEAWATQRWGEGEDSSASKTLGRHSTPASVLGPPASARHAALPEGSQLQ